MVQKRIVKEIGPKTVSFTRSCEVDVKVISGDELKAATLPRADDPGTAEHFRLVGVRGDRKVRQCLKVNIGRIRPDWRIEQLDLITLQAWFSQGNIPIDTYVDEVIEPSFLHPETGDTSSVL